MVTGKVALDKAASVKAVVVSGKVVVSDRRLVMDKHPVTDKRRAADLFWAPRPRRQPA